LSTTKVAIIGSGSTSVDLLTKIRRLSSSLAVAAIVGTDPDSEGIALATQLGIPIVSGFEGLIGLPDFDDIKIVFDATSAEAHRLNATRLAQYDKQLIGLTPTPVGPYIVPAVNLEQHLDAPYVSMVTCGGQSTVPIIAAISQVTPVHYGEIVTTIASEPAGPGAQAHIKELTETASAAIQAVGGAARGRAIMVVNAAERQLIMRDTVRCLTDPLDDEARSVLRASIEAMVAAVGAYIPGYRLKQQVQIWTVDVDEPVAGPSGDLEPGEYDEVSVFLQVEDAPATLPGYVDMMTSAARVVAERMALGPSTQR
jgi:acetaldehyde dehydrogenase